MKTFGFTCISQAKQSRARLGEITTPHGDIQTPAFVAVGTQATVKSLTPDELKDLGVQLLIVNTYHTYLRPGIDVIKKFGGLHKFMGWSGPIITDSGGFQVFSLKPKITDDGVTFQSHWDGTKHEFTPEKSIEIQNALGADIIIAFDECTTYPTTHQYAHKAMERTHRWAKRSLAYKHSGAMYGVVQGSIFEDLRKESAKFISSMDFDGIAIGGVSVGESKEEMKNVLEWVVPYLPSQIPRHLLGVGEIDDIFTLVEYGMDTFDCVQPTRLARMGKLFTKTRAIDINKIAFAKDRKPIDNCDCYTCQHFSRAYLHHLFRVRELLAYRLATIHNIHFVHSLLSDIRYAISKNTFLELKKQWLYNKAYA